MVILVEVAQKLCTYSSHTAHIISYVEMIGTSNLYCIALDSHCMTKIQVHLYETMISGANILNNKYCA